MKADQIIEVINALTGPIYPAGFSHIDENQFENLKVKCEIIDHLVLQVQEVSRLKDRTEHSIKKSGEYAHEFLRDIKEDI